MSGRRGILVLGLRCWRITERRSGCFHSAVGGLNAGSFGVGHLFFDGPGVSVFIGSIAGRDLRSVGLQTGDEVQKGAILEPQTFVYPICVPSAGASALCRSRKTRLDSVRGPRFLPLMLAGKFARGAADPVTDATDGTASLAGRLFSRIGRPGAPPSDIAWNSSERVCAGPLQGDIVHRLVNIVAIMTFLVGLRSLAAGSTSVSSPGKASSLQEATAPKREVDRRAAMVETEKPPRMARKVDAAWFGDARRAIHG